MAIVSNGQDDTIRVAAQELEFAIIALFQTHDPVQQQLANSWLNDFVCRPSTWTVSLYLAFPPAASTVGLSPEVRFFALNLLLSKLRSDWTQLEQTDAEEIYETLLRQIPLNSGDKIVGPRLCVVVSAAAALAGADTCKKLVNNLVQQANFALDFDDSLAIDMLTALAEETLHRLRALSWKVGECMQYCYPEVLAFLQSKVSAKQGLHTKAFKCLERWIRAGLTLSELHSEYPALFQALLVSLELPDKESFMAAVTALSELISSVDLLPGRERAVQATVSAISKHKWCHPTAYNGHGVWDGTAENKERRLVFCSLISVLGCAEASYLCRGSYEEALLIDWLVEASSGGWGMGLEGASMAGEVWPKLAAIHFSKRKDALQKKHFAGAVQSIMKIAMYPLDFEDWESSSIEEEDFHSFRDCVAEDALAACFQELGNAFVTLLSDQLRGAKNWQQAEVSIYVVTCLSSKFLKAVGADNFQSPIGSNQEQASLKTFLSGFFSGIHGTPPAIETVISAWPHGRLVEIVARALDNYAEWISLDKATLENAVNFSVRALYVPDARGRAAKALRSLCQAAAPHLAAAQALAPLMGACEQAVSASMGVLKGLEVSESINIIQGLAAVAAALPSPEAETALSRLTVSAVATLKELSAIQEKTDKSRDALIMALKLVAAVVEYGVVPRGIRVHPALPVLQDIWSALEFVAGHWASDVLVITALCELWGISASNVGVMITEILPKIVYTVSDMFKQHLVAPCLDCLSNIVLLLASDENSDPEIRECLSYALFGITSTMEALEGMINNSNPSKDPIQQLLKPHKGKEVGEQFQDKALESFRAICGLGRSFLRSSPFLFLPSPAFGAVLHCAIACLQRVDVNPAAASFLAEAIVCGSFDVKEVKENACWKLPAQLVPLVDQAMAFSGALIVEVVLENIARCQLTVVLRELLADILYGLCLRYAAATESAMGSTLNSSKFPAKSGALKDADRRHFIAAAVRQPAHPRRRFQELVGDFAQVCQALVPAEVLLEY